MNNDVIFLREYHGNRYIIDAGKVPAYQGATPSQYYRIMVINKDGFIFLVKTYDDLQRCKEVFASSFRFLPDLVSGLMEV